MARTTHDADGAAADAATELSGPAQHGLELYRRMLVVRRFEETVQSLFQKGEVHGTTHLYVGEEAGAVGVADVLGPQDRVAGTYRGHGHALALGVDPQALLDEMLGRETGVCGGRAGSMNVIDLANRLIGCFGIIGGSISAATGAALALRTQGDGVAVAFFGEGTTNHGYFHECLNFAAVLRLPVLFVCENNRYGEFTPFEDVTAGDIAARPQTLGIPTETVDGMDVWAVREAAEAAVSRARAGEGPQFIQSMTYRFVGHSRSDPGRYRKAGELDEWKQRDPLKVARERLADAFGVPGDAVDGVDGAVDAQFEAIVERALAAPYPEPARDAAREFAP
ncbi:thiamine pyrophosphate-dependent dehydrogenase E1 component subunit alpha [Conexibacter sp. CPCC 206217]|uniref:thiamine pyrophosphate-dependent dehydrogenase E1 component subunit alpha n=1 Tax=Conexibacter sp. CPCC 206217 TaxID=3064574 RepID=UPI002724E6EE|nr:thiamine pyrophosphate-dependent dehydrogenase E1 component subunit alpha [Conexibacter sp. CPCC 206217]MDO8211890.1 thiamine pyrophosphate-dependent dehydrogenase E1 component subunit alpha [Conexibacter sp. CPCC 206217]